MKQFVETPAGRLLVFALGLALVGGGAATLAGEMVSIWLQALTFPLAVAISIVAIAMAVEDSWFYAVRAAVMLPPALLSYEWLLGVLAGSALAGWTLLVIGGGALALGVRPRVEAPHLQPAPQHH